MMNNNFQLSQQADPNKIFLTKFSELEGRFDPFYYKNDFINLNNRINNSPFKVQRLHQISKNIVNGFDCRNYVDNGITYLKVSNIKIDNIDINSVAKIPYQKIHKDSIIKKDDLLLTRKGTFGVSAVVKAINNNSVISSEIFKILLKDKENSLYISYWFNTKAGQAYFNRIKTGAIMGHITQEALGLFPIPIPPKNIQAEIVAKMDTAYQDKKDKEAQAQNLLDSIDTYLLNELEIDLPKPADNSLKARMFTKKFSNIIGGRLDAEYYQNQYIDFENSLMEKCEYIFLKELLQRLESGSRPTGGVGNIESGILSFGGTHVGSDGYIDTSKAKYIPIEYHQKNLATATKINDLLLVKDGATTGKIAIIQNLEHENQNINEHVFLMRLKNNVNPIFLLSYLKSSFGNMQIKREITGATVTGLTKDVINALKVPLPPLEKQNQIAEHISKIRNKAKQLQTEAKTGLEQAKQQVEDIILGNKL